MGDWRLFTHKTAAKKHGWDEAACVVWAREDDSGKRMTWDELGRERNFTTWEDEMVHVRYPLNWAGFGSEKAGKEKLTEPERCAKTDPFPRGAFHAVYEPADGPS